VNLELRYWSSIAVVVVCALVLSSNFDAPDLAQSLDLHTHQQLDGSGFFAP
jgi:hypothetical protein